MRSVHDVVKVAALSVFEDLISHANEQSYQAANQAVLVVAESANPVIKKIALNILTIFVRKGYEPAYEGACRILCSNPLQQVCSQDELMLFQELVTKKCVSIYEQAMKASEIGGNSGGQLLAILAKQGHLPAVKKLEEQQKAALPRFIRAPVVSQVSSDDWD